MRPVNRDSVYRFAEYAPMNVTRAAAMFVARVYWFGRPDLVRELQRDPFNGRLVDQGAIDHALALECAGKPPLLADLPPVLKAWYPRPYKPGRPRADGQTAMGFVIPWLSNGVGDPGLRGSELLRACQRCLAGPAPVPELADILERATAALDAARAKVIAAHPCLSDPDWF